MRATVELIARGQALFSRWDDQPRASAALVDPAELRKLQHQHQELAGLERSERGQPAPALSALRQRLGSDLYRWLDGPARELERRLARARRQDQPFDLVIALLKEHAARSPSTALCDRVRQAVIVSARDRGGGERRG